MSVFAMAMACTCSYAQVAMADRPRSTGCFDIFEAASGRKWGWALRMAARRYRLPTRAARPVRASIYFARDGIPCWNEGIGAFNKEAHARER